MYLLNLTNIYLYQLGLFMIKIHHSLPPPVFDNMFQINYSILSYTIRHNGHLNVPVTKYKCVQQSVLFIGIKLWNMEYSSK